MGMVKVFPVIDPSIRDLCRKPYPGHPRGCPNYGRRKTCPPAVPLLDKVFKIPADGVMCVYNRFDLSRHVDRMKSLHPNWSVRQLHCCLYWQGTARKELREHIADWLDEPRSNPFDRVDILEKPEAFGVNVTETMESVGIKMEWPPRLFAYQVVFIMFSKEGDKP